MIRNTNVQNVSLFKCLKSRSEKHLKIKREQRPIKPPMHEIRTHQHSLLKLTRTLVAKALGHNKHTQWDHVWEARPIENDQGSKEAGRRNESEHYQRHKTQQPDKPQRKRYSTFPHTETCRSTSAPNRAERRAKITARAQHETSREAPIQRVRRVLQVYSRAATAGTQRHGRNSPKVDCQIEN